MSRRLALRRALLPFSSAHHVHISCCASHFTSPHLWPLHKPAYAAGGGAAACLPCLPGQQAYCSSASTTAPDAPLSEQAQALSSAAAATDTHITQLLGMVTRLPDMGQAATVFLGVFQQRVAAALLGADAPALRAIRDWSRTTAPHPPSVALALLGGVTTALQHGPLHHSAMALTGSICAAAGQFSGLMGAEELSVLLEACEAAFQRAMESRADSQSANGSQRDTIQRTRAAALLPSLLPALPLAQHRRLVRKVQRFLCTATDTPAAVAGALQQVLASGGDRVGFTALPVPHTKPLAAAPLASTASPSLGVFGSAVAQPHLQLQHDLDSSHDGPLTSLSFLLHHYSAEELLGPLDVSALLRLLQHCQESSPASDVLAHLESRCAGRALLMQGPRETLPQRCLAVSRQPLALRHLAGVAASCVGVLASPPQEISLDPLQAVLAGGVTQPDMPPGHAESLRHRALIALKASAKVARACLDSKHRALAFTWAAEVAAIDSPGWASLAADYEAASKSVRSVLLNIAHSNPPRQLADSWHVATGIAKALQTVGGLPTTHGLVKRWEHRAPAEGKSQPPSRQIREQVLSCALVSAAASLVAPSDHDEAVVEAAFETLRSGDAQPALIALGQALPPLPCELEPDAALLLHSLTSELLQTCELGALRPPLTGALAKVCGALGDEAFAAWVLGQVQWKLGQKTRDVESREALQALAAGLGVALPEDASDAVAHIPPCSTPHHLLREARKLPLERLQSLERLVEHKQCLVVATAVEPGARGLVGLARDVVRMTSVLQK